ncbi:hypothetical protein ACFFRR_006310 [Megaselia abdita]
MLIVYRNQNKRVVLSAFVYFIIKEKLTKLMDPHDENDHNSFQEIANTNLSKISKNIQNIGYTDGITDGRESVFQNGFDQGYCDGLRLSFEIQKFKKTAEILLNSSKIEKSDELRKELEDLSSLSPRDQKHFKMLDNMNKPITEVSELQNSHTSDVLRVLKENYPNLYDVIGV